MCDIRNHHRAGGIKQITVSNIFWLVTPNRIQCYFFVISFVTELNKNKIKLSYKQSQTENNVKL
jgi:hypothetical protein